MYSIAAKQAKGKFAQDNIFAANNKAVALADKLGNDKVINATVGSILDEDGNLVVLDVVQEEYKKLTPRQAAQVFFTMQYIITVKLGMKSLSPTGTGVLMTV